MAITLHASGTKTATGSGTEDSVTTVVVSGAFSFHIDAVNMVAGDIVELRVYRIILTGGTKRVLLFAAFYGAQPTHNIIKEIAPIFNDLTDASSIEFTIKQTFGTGRAFPWKVLREDSGTAQTGDAYTIVNNGTYGNSALSGRIPTALTTNGNMKASLVEILTTALTETAGLLAGGFKKFFNVSSPTGTLNSIPDAIAGGTGGIFIAGTNAATTVTTSFTTTFTGNLTGSVNSLTTWDKTGYAIGTGGITDLSFAANAINAAALATDATTEITAGIRIKKNTALANFMFLMVDSTDHVTPKTGLTITATRSIDGAAFAACANSATEVANGMYKINLAATDLNGDVITLRFTGTAADARLITIVTTA